MNNPKICFNKLDHTYLLRLTKVILLSIWVHNFVDSQILTQSRTIFAVSEKKAEKNETPKIIILGLDKYDTKVNLKYQNGKTITLDLGIKTKEIGDMKVGDVDNDGEDEIVFITKTHLQVIEKIQDKFIIDSSKTIPLYGLNSVGDQAFITSYIESFYEPSEYVYSPTYVTEKDKNSGSLAIGDLGNDGKNEIVFMKTLFYNDDPQGPVKQFYSSCDVLRWDINVFKIIDTMIFFGDGQEGAFILDMDGDLLNELVIADAFKLYVYKSAIGEEKIIEPPIPWWNNQFINKNLYLESSIDFGINMGEQRISLKRTDDKILLSQCTLWNIRNVRQDNIINIGEIRTYELSYEISKEGRKKFPSKRKYKISEFKEIAESIQLPISKFKDSNVPMVKLKSLVLGDVDNDSKLDVIANMEDQAQVYKNIYNIGKSKKQNFMK